MAKKRDDLHERLLRDLQALKLSRIAEVYQEILNEAARKDTSMLEVLSTLVADEATLRSERALERRMRAARLPKQKRLEQYDIVDPVEEFRSECCAELCHHSLSG